MSPISIQVLVLLAHGNPIEELIAKCRQAREEGGEEESHHGNEGDTVERY